MTPLTVVSRIFSGEIIKMTGCALVWYILILGSVRYSLAGNQCKYLTIPICDEEQTISDVTEEVVRNNRQVQDGQGLPGKRGPVGPPGQKGDKGDKGLPGTNGDSISLDEVEEVIERTAQSNYSTNTGS